MSVLSFPLLYQSVSEHEIAAMALETGTGQAPFPTSNSPAWQADPASHLKTNLQPMGLLMNICCKVMVLIMVPFYPAPTLTLMLSGTCQISVI